MALRKVYCVTGIDTDVGKTVVAGLIARSFIKNDINVITQKMVQTGCNGLSEDIIFHRQLMGIDLLPEDVDGLTCPYRFSVPSSPHLAAALEQNVIDCDQIKAATMKLLRQFECVILEGVGGLSVPLNNDMTVLDYLEKEQYPMVLVSSSRLGSINHTLNALELARKRNLEVVAIVYNLIGETDPRIVKDSRIVFQRFLKKYGFPSNIIDLPEINVLTVGNNIPDFFNALQ